MIRCPQWPAPASNRAGTLPRSRWPVGGGVPCLLTGLALLILLTACQTTPVPGSRAKRTGDEIIVAGQLFHTGTRVVTWLDAGGYDAYRVERRFSALTNADWASSAREVKALETPNRYGLRRDRLTPEQIEQVRGGGWELALLTNVVDQFVIHFDACGTSRQCFKVLHDLRGLSVHFLLDVDGTIYQTLDLKERAWHATTSNSRSVGIEIAQIGAYPPARAKVLDEWYRTEPDGRVRITIPERFGDGGLRTPGFVGRPVRHERVRGRIQGIELEQYDFTPEQYRALAHLTAALCRIFPKLTCDYPRDSAGRAVPVKLPDEELGRYQGLLGHWHIQTDKVDPGPAFQWDKLVREARELSRPARAVESPKGRAIRAGRPQSGGRAGDPP
ncbi:MAG: N-acetylmuramoyl-L-alanine amidase [Verrucomicrobia bacterium]|nr:N-acetylmuramoyl-L-alanine amidase [Verrucomicrobiota bacterium]